MRSQRTVLVYRDGADDLRVRVHEDEGRGVPDRRRPQPSTKTLRRPSPSETSRWIRDESDAFRRRRARLGGGLGDQVYNRLLGERIIFLGQPVDDDIANKITAQLLLLAADPDKDIYLYINSPGGSVTAGMAIYDTMQYIKNDVVTIAMGLAASMGQFLLTAGTPASASRCRTPRS